MGHNSRQLLYFTFTVVENLYFLFIYLNLPPFSSSPFLQFVFNSVFENGAYSCLQVIKVSLHKTKQVRQVVGDRAILHVQKSPM